MNEKNPAGLDIDLVQTPFPGHITVVVEDIGKLVVHPTYATLAEGLCDAIIFFARGKVLSLTADAVVANTTVTAIDTEKRTIRIRYNYEN